LKIVLSLHFAWLSLNWVVASKEELLEEQIKALALEHMTPV
jgi:hypothetical protein